MSTSPDQPQPPDPSEEAVPSSDPQDLSRLLLAQFEQRLKDNLGATQRSPDYYVIRSQKTGVLSVLASSTLGDDHDVVRGPLPFADCIGYVNSVMVTREARGDAPGAKEEKP